MVFVTAGMGGGTGTGASPIVAEAARSIGALTVGVVTLPFGFEGSRRYKNAMQGIEDLRSNVDALVIIPNDRLLKMADNQMTVVDAFRLADDVLRQGVQGISDLVTQTGLINLDFADVKAVMGNAGTALMAMGEAVGEERGADAARAAITSSLLETSIEGATGVLINVTGGADLTLHEVTEAANVISEVVDPSANIIFGAVIHPRYQKELRVTVIATGLRSGPDARNMRSINSPRDASPRDRDRRSPRETLQMAFDDDRSRARTVASRRRSAHIVAAAAQRLAGRQRRRRYRSASVPARPLGGVAVKPRSSPPPINRRGCLLERFRDDVVSPVGHRGIADRDLRLLGEGGELTEGRSGGVEREVGGDPEQGHDGGLRAIETLCAKGTQKRLCLEVTRRKHEVPRCLPPELRDLRSLPVLGCRVIDFEHAPVVCPGWQSKARCVQPGPKDHELTDTPIFGPR